MRTEKKEQRRERRQERRDDRKARRDDRQASRDQRREDRQRDGTGLIGGWIRSKLLGGMLSRAVEKLKGGHLRSMWTIIIVLIIGKVLLGTDAVIDQMAELIGAEWLPQAIEWILYIVAMLLGNPGGVLDPIKGSNQTQSTYEEHQKTLQPGHHDDHLHVRAHAGTDTH